MSSLDKSSQRRQTLAQRHDVQVLWLARLVGGLGGLGVIVGCWAMLSGYASFAGLAVAFIGVLLCGLCLMAKGLSEFTFGMGDFTASMRRSGR